MGSTGSLNIYCGYFPSFQMHNRNRHTQQLADSPSWFPDLWNEGHDGGKGQVEATSEPEAIPTTFLEGL